MEGVSTTMYKGLRGYWRRRGYERINGAGRKRQSRLQLGPTTRRRRLWRIKIKPKLKILKVASPKKFFIWLRDAYVRMMMGFANSSVCSRYGGALAGDRGYAFGRGALKEYDEKMLVEIYKSLVMAQGQFMPPDAPKLGSQIVCKT